MLSDFSTIPSDKSRTPISNRVQGKNILAIASPKSGIGKSFLALSVSQALSRQNKSVLLFDGDLGLSNFNLPITTPSVRDLNAVLECRLPLNVLTSSPQDFAFQVITGRSGKKTLGNISLSRLYLIRDDLKALASHYDYVIIDSGSGLEKTISFLTGLAQTTWVICTSEPDSLQKTISFVQMLHSKAPEMEIGLLINFARSKQEGDETYATLCRAIYPCCGFTPFLVGIILKEKEVAPLFSSKKSDPICPPALIEENIKEIVKPLLSSF